MATVMDRASLESVPTSRRRTLRAVALLVLVAFVASGAFAQGAESSAVSAGSPSPFRPRLAITQTWTDNLRADGSALTANVGGLKDAALITSLSPGFTAFSNSGRLRGSIDYSLSAIGYLKTDVSSRLQNSLSARGSLDVVPQTLLVDMTASAGQQAGSAFGAQSFDSSISAANRREVLTLAVSPSFRSRLGTWGDLVMRVDEQRTEVRGTGLGDGRSESASVRVDAREGAAVRLFAQASRRRGQFQGAVNSTVDSATMGFTYTPDADWTVVVNGGTERSDLVSSTSATGSTWGATANWVPGPRTRMSVDWQHHAYGDTHTMAFEHRMSRASFRFTDTDTLNQGFSSNGGRLTNYDLYYQLFASREPDPAKRDDLVRSYLRSLGLPLDGLAGTGFISSSPNRQRMQQVGFSLLGQRTTLTGQMGRTRTRQVGASATGDLALSSSIDQRTYSLSGAHQLTPSSSISVTGSRTQSRGLAVSQFTRLDSLLANWTGRLGARSTVVLGLRHSRSQGAQAYSENSVTASMTQQF